MSSQSSNAAWARANKLCKQNFSEIEKDLFLDVRVNSYMTHMTRYKLESQSNSLCI